MFRRDITINLSGATPTGLQLYLSGSCLGAIAMSTSYIFILFSLFLILPPSSAFSVECQEKWNHVCKVNEALKSINDSSQAKTSSTLGKIIGKPPHQLSIECYSNEIQSEEQALLLVQQILDRAESKVTSYWLGPTILDAKVVASVDGKSIRISLASFGNVCVQIADGKTWFLNQYSR